MVCWRGGSYWCAVSRSVTPHTHVDLITTVKKDTGGVFEKNYGKLLIELLEGKRDGVMQLPFTPGTLLIFGGRQTIHRVTRVSGTTPRLVPVLCYAEKPDLVNSEQVRKLFWGRAGVGG